MKRKLIVVGIILGILMILACGNTVDTSKAKKVDDVTADSKEKNTEDKKVDKIFKINEEIKLDNAVLTVMSMEKSKGGEFDTKKEGMEFAIVTIKLKNVGKTERISYSSFEFKIENSQGVIQDNTYTSVVPMFDSGELSPGGEITGKMSFEVPINDPKLTLEYQPNMFLDSVIRVALNY